MTEQRQTPEDRGATDEPDAAAAPSASEGDQPAPITDAAVPPPPDPPTAVTPPPPPPPIEPVSAGPAPGEPSPPLAPPPPPEPPPVGAGAAAGAAAVNDRPEVPIAAAFAGGFVFAMILKRLAR